MLIRSESSCACLACLLIICLAEVFLLEIYWKGNKNRPVARISMPSDAVYYCFPLLLTSRKTKNWRPRWTSGQRWWPLRYCCEPHMLCTSMSQWCRCFCHLCYFNMWPNHSSWKLQSFGKFTMLTCGIAAMNIRRQLERLNAALKLVVCNAASDWSARPWISTHLLGYSGKPCYKSVFSPSHFPLPFDRVGQFLSKRADDQSQKVVVIKIIKHPSDLLKKFENFKRILRLLSYAHLLLFGQLVVSSCLEGDNEGAGCMVGTFACCRFRQLRLKTCVNGVMSSHAN